MLELYQHVPCGRRQVLCSQYRACGGVQSYGKAWTSRSRSCENKVKGATSSLPVLLRAQERAPDGICSASMIYLRSQWGCLGAPQNVSIPDPCCDLSAAELDSHMLGPVQTLVESLNRFVSLGDKDHINRRQTSSGREIRVTSRCKYHCGRNMKEPESRGRNNPL
jgi:hypothetical protein